MLFQERGKKRLESITPTGCDLSLSVSALSDKIALATLKGVNHSQLQHSDELLRMTQKAWDADNFVKKRADLQPSPRWSASQMEMNKALGLKEKHRDQWLPEVAMFHEKFLEFHEKMQLKAVNLKECWDLAELSGFHAAMGKISEVEDSPQYFTNINTC